jgi:hypothetical protein
MAYVQSNVNSSLGSTNLSVALTGVVAGNLLILAIDTSGSGTTVTSVDDTQSNSWNRVVSRRFQAGGGGVEIWAAYNVNGGDTTVTAHYSANVINDIHVVEVDNVPTSAIFDTSSSNGGASGTDPDSGSTPTISNENEFILGFLSYGAATLAEDSNFTSLQSGALISHTAYREVSSTGSYIYDPAFTSGASAWACEIATFKMFGSASFSQPAYMNAVGSGTPASDSQPAYLSGRGTIHLDNGVTYQTMLGWSVTCQAQQDYTADWDLYKDSLLDDLVNVVGVNRLRVVVRSGQENPVDWYTQTFLTQSFPRTELPWQDHFYESINDNADPDVINYYGYQWYFVDKQFVDFVIPMRALLAERGESLYVNLCLVDFDNHRGSYDLLLGDDADEFAEFFLALWQHIDIKYGFVPDSLEVCLEPDNVSSWTGTDIGNAIKAAGDKLAANGYYPDIIAPACLNMNNAISYFDAAVAVSGVTAYISELSYHRYSGVSDANLTAIGARGTTYGIRTAMLEHIGSGYLDLYKDLTLAKNSAWQQHTIAWASADNSGYYFVLDLSTPGSPTYTLSDSAKYLRQYFLHARRGAVRISADSSDGNLFPVAFVNANGGYTVVVYATGASGTFEIDGLPQATYGIFHAISGAYDVQHSDQVPVNGVISTSIPAAGVITIYEKVPQASQPAYLFGQNQPLLPDGDIGSSGTWVDEGGSSSSLYQSVDEHPVYSDGDYVHNSLAQSGDYVEFSLQNPPATPSSGDVNIFWRVKREYASVEPIQVKVELRQGGTVISTDTRFLPDNETTFQKTLSAGEKAAITDWNDLRLRITVI